MTDFQYSSSNRFYFLTEALGFYCFAERLGMSNDEFPFPMFKDLAILHWASILDIPSAASQNAYF